MSEILTPAAIAAIRTRHAHAIQAPRILNGTSVQAVLDPHGLTTSVLTVALLQPIRFRGDSWKSEGAFQAAAWEDIGALLGTLDDATATITRLTAELEQAKAAKVQPGKKSA